MDIADEVTLEAITMIAAYGVQVTCVGASAATVPFAYTAGLTDRDHRELVLLGGVPPLYAQVTLNDLAFRVINDGVRFTAGDRLSDVLDGYDVVIAGPVDPQWDDLYPISMAKAIYGRERAGRPLQVVYPDKDGNFPWDEGYTMGVPLICAPPPGTGDKT